MRVLVTGGSGFIGTNVIERCRQDGIVAANLDIRPPRHAGHAEVWRSVDLVDREAVDRAVSELRPTHVLHLGARTDLQGRSVADYTANTVGTQNLTRALRDAGTVECAVFASSRLVCEVGYQPKDEFDVRPTTPYGASKVETEQIVRAASLGFAWIIVRPTSIWGPWFGVPYRNFFDSVVKGRYVHPRNAVIRKSFGYVGNTVDQLFGLLAAPALVDGHTTYLADHEPLEIGAWARLIAAEAGAPPVREVPMPVLRAVALAGDMARRVGVAEPPLTSFRLNNLLTEMVHDTSFLECIVGELSIGVEEGVRLTVQWMREQTASR